MSPALRAAAVLAFFAALTALLAYPLSLDPGSRALPLSADTRLFLWTIGWDVHALTTDPLHVFDANIFFPERHTLAYSEHLLGSAALGAPFLLASGDLLLAVNAIVLLSCVLSGAGTYFLARRLGVGVAGSLAAGVVFAFAPPRFFRMAQVHLATVQWIPFGLGFLHGYAREGSRRDLVAAAGLFTLQSLTSGHGGLFLLLAMGALLIYLWTLGLLSPLPRMLRDLGLAGALILATSVVLLVPYAQVRRDVGLHRTLGAVEDWAPNAASFLAAPTHAQQALLGLASPRYRDEVSATARAFLFPGWLTLALATLALRRRGAPPQRAEAPPESSTPAPPAPLGLVALDALIALVGLLALVVHVQGGIEWRLAGATLTARTPSRTLIALAVLVALRAAAGRRTPFAFARPMRRAAEAFRRWAERRMGVALGFYVVLAAASLWASFGPSFGLYLVLYRLLPGFDLIRVPSRLTILTLLALAVLAGHALDRLLSAMAALRPRIALGAAAVVLLITEFAAFPLRAPPYAMEIPAIDRWLASQPGRSAIAELPVADPGDATASARLHSTYMLHSTAHWRPMVNGYSGFVPPRHETLFRVLTLFPDSASVGALEALGVGEVVVHRASYSEQEWARVESGIAALGDRVRLEHEEPDGRVYSLTARRQP